MLPTCVFLLGSTSLRLDQQVVLKIESFYSRPSLSRISTDTCMRISEYIDNKLECK